MPDNNEAKYEAVVRCPYCGTRQMRNMEIVSGRENENEEPSITNLSIPLICVRDPAIYDALGTIYVKCDECGKVFERTMVPTYRCEKVNE